MVHVQYLVFCFMEFLLIRRNQCEFFYDVELIRCLLFRWSFVHFRLHKLVNVIKPCLTNNTLKFAAL